MGFVRTPQLASSGRPMVTPVSSSDYLVILRAISAAHLPFHDPLLAQLPGVHCEVKSEHVGGEDGWPVALRGEARGNRRPATTVALSASTGRR